MVGLPKHDMFASVAVNPRSQHSEFLAISGDFSDPWLPRASLHAVGTEAPEVSSGEGGARLFSYDVRIITCRACGAPLTTSIVGGTFACQYCSVVNQVSARNDVEDRKRAQATTTTSESERIAALRL